VEKIPFYIEIIYLFIFIIIFFYFVLVTIYFWAWKHATTFIPPKKQPTTKISLIIAARNEEANIEKLLQCIVNQIFPKHLLEVIFVNDHSTDATVDIIENYCRKFNFIQLIHLNDNELGKKAAIKKAILIANGKLIITTDADCEMNCNWLTINTLYYETYKPKFIVGTVLYHNESNIFERMQSLEFMSLVAAGVSATILKNPIYCNAANMAFERKMYIELQNALNEKYTSGDDVFLLQQTKITNRKDIHFLKSTDNVVITKPQPSITQFINQRKRWASKSKGYSDASSIFVALLVFFVNIILFIFAVLSFVSVSYAYLFLSVFILKSIPDFLLLQSFTSYFGKQKLLRCFFPLQCVYFLYISYTTVFGLLGNFTWKNREFKSTFGH